MSRDRKNFLEAGDALGKSLWVVPAFSLTPPHQTQRQAEQSKAADIEFIPEELKAMNDAVSKMTVVEDRYTGQPAQQVRQWALSIYGCVF